LHPPPTRRSADLGGGHGTRRGAADDCRRGGSDGLRSVRGATQRRLPHLPGAQLLPGTDRRGQAQPMSTFRAARIAETLGQPAPTPEQAAGIEAPLQPILVSAGPGSGRTETLACRAARLGANGTGPPREQPGRAVTRRAASELSVRIRSRLPRLARHTAAVNVSVDNRPRIATYNSYAAGIVTDHGLRLGIDPDATLISAAGRHQIADAIISAW